MDAPDHPSSLPHLHAHHGDFSAFRDAMIETSPGRFGPMWWGIWQQLVAPPPSPTIVDLGTGPGLLLRGLRERHPDAKLYGVDVQPAMLEAARAVAVTVDAEILVADLSGGVPLPDGCADVVTAVHLLHELLYPIDLVAEIARLTRPGGVAVVYDWVKMPLRDYVGDKEMTPGLLQHFREHCLYERADLEWMIERAGFRVRETVLRRGGRYAVVVAERVGNAEG